MSPKANAFSIDSILGQRDVKSQEMIEEHSTRDHELPATPPHADSPPGKSFFSSFHFFLYNISFYIYHSFHDGLSGNIQKYCMANIR
jgi:hypothetical protein